MKAIAFNGSPRKKNNTGQLLEKALDGAASLGWETEMVHLYDLLYTGCISCFACKTIDGASYGSCGMCDDLTPILERAAEADMLLLGSPVYLGTETGQMRSFMERLLFPYLAYAKDPVTLFTRPVRTALVYTSGLAEKDFPAFGLDTHVTIASRFMSRVFGHNEMLFCTETKQFDKPERIFAPAKDIPYLEQRHLDVFPQDLDNAYQLGKRLAEELS